MEKETQKRNSSQTHTMYIVIITVLVVALAGSFYFHKDLEKSHILGMAEMKQQMLMSGKGSMKAITPPSLSDQQTQQLTEGTSSATTKKIFNITGGNFYFVPNKITVNQGDQVTFIMTNAGGMHDLVIDELGVKTPIVKTANVATATFTASKKGSFVYYCDVHGHKQKGMWGTLTIQ